MSQCKTFWRLLVKTLWSVVFIILLSGTPAFSQGQCRALFTETYISTNQLGWLQKNLRIITLNAQDFTLYEKPNSTLRRPEPKNEGLVRAMAQKLFEYSPDIIVMQEVGNKYTLQKLASMSPSEEYEIIIINGNDNYPGDYSRNIGFLVKKSLKLAFKVETNLRIPFSGLDHRQYLFDRGLPVVTFFRENQPQFALIGIHNHSLGKDRAFADIKQAEEQAMLSVLEQIKNTYGQKFPTIMAGDFNVSVNKRNELQQLKAQMTDAFTDSGVDSDDSARETQSFTIKDDWNEDHTISRQVDAVLINRPLLNRVRQCLTLLFSKKGISDHRPVLVDLNFEGVIP